MKRIIKTLFALIVLCVMWMLAEILIYGEIQPRLVDDIMMIIFIPFIYRSTGKKVEE